MKQFHSDLAAYLPLQLRKRLPKELTGSQDIGLWQFMIALWPLRGKTLWSGNLLKALSKKLDGFLPYWLFTQKEAGSMVAEGRIV